MAKLNAQQGMLAALRWLPATGLPAVARRRYGGIGTIFTLHSVVREKRPSYSFMRDMDLSESFLEEVLKDYLRRGYHVASMDDIASYLEGAPRPERFVAFTFDDGYRNNLEVACPLFARYAAPFIVYVATDLIDGIRVPWQYGLQETIRARASIRVDLGGGSREIALRSDDERARAFDTIAAHAHALASDACDAWCRELFRANDVDASELTARTMLSWDMVRELASSPFASVGSHAVSHIPLSPLDDDRLRREVEGSQRRIEDELGSPVRHFSYPYGGYGQVREREIACVASRGFRTAVTTRSANVFAGHAAAPCALPRQPLSGAVEDLAVVRVLDSGLPSALLYGLRRVVTDQGGLKRLL
jgi:peptidoglycan/xylan/chitin deacetylase (PgdA/CDA1 family)